MHNLSSIVNPWLNHFHSVLRWLLLAGLVSSIVIALNGILIRKDLSPAGKKISRITVYLAHIQLIMGLCLYLISPKVVFSAGSMQSPILRFYLVEHISAMILSIALITIGHALMKRSGNPSRSASRIFWFYLLSLLIILAMIPWPSSSYGGHWL
jgi:thiosulfate reductase cytochrome b subunit